MRTLFANAVSGVLTCVSAAAALTVGDRVEAAHPHPSKPVRVTQLFAAGGGMEAVPRVMADNMHKFDSCACADRRTQDLTC